MPNIQVITIEYNNDEERRIVNETLNAMVAAGSLGTCLEMRIQVDGDGEFRIKAGGIDNIDMEQRIENELFENEDDTVDFLSIY